MGSALASQLLGEELWLSGRNQARLESLAASLGAQIYPAAEVAALAQAVSLIDLLIYAAGAVERALIKEPSRDLFAANFWGAYFLLRHLRWNPGGRALFLGAYPRYIAYPGFGLYAASKAALEGLLEVARKELKDVSFCLVRLPAVRTPLWAPLGGAPRGALSPEEAAQKIISKLAPPAYSA